MMDAAARLDNFELGPEDAGAGIGRASGYGNIGRKVAEMARVLGLRVIVAGRVGEDRQQPDRLPPGGGAAAGRFR